MRNRWARDAGVRPEAECDAEEQPQRWCRRIPDVIASTGPRSGGRPAIRERREKRRGRAVEVGIYEVLISCPTSVRPLDVAHIVAARERPEPIDIAVGAPQSLAGC
jgi:hypothetical protein